MVEAGEIPVAETVGGRNLIDVTVADYMQRQMERERQEASA